MPASLKHNRDSSEDDEEGHDEQLHERNRCRLCGKFFIRLAFHQRSCRPHRENFLKILNDARQTLSDRRRLHMHSNLAYTSNSQVALQSHTAEGPGQCSATEITNDIEVSWNHLKFSQKGD